jgi:glycosyltransferase involved in cell wall biosynthesis
MNFYVTANLTGVGVDSIGMSGGDRIASAIINKLVREGHSVTVFTGRSGLRVYAERSTRGVEYIETNSVLWKRFSHLGLFVYEVLAMIRGSISALRVKPPAEGRNFIYSASDFWPDAFPSFLLKLRNPRAEWIAGFYMFAPKPWRKESPYKGKRRIIGALYFLSQIPIYWIIRRYADTVFVTSEPDITRFVTHKRNAERIVAVRGGVDTAPSEMYLSSGNVIPVMRRKYDAVFVGRFHPQKGVMELVDIWKTVCARIPVAKLAIIGTGYLEDELRGKVKSLDLGSNIELLGFMDGPDKYEIFKQSKIVVHPAAYDSGGMAACEAMAWGLPGVSFDLESLKTYYPTGMIKTPCFDLSGFAQNIVNLLRDNELYERVSWDAIAWAREWDWDKRLKEMFRKIEVD